MLIKLRIVAVLAFCYVNSVAATIHPTQQPITISLDTREASRKIFHAQLDIPVNPGPLSLYYPKWIPGHHAPTNPIAELVGIHFSANGKDISWQRDLVDMYQFHCDIPAGTQTLHVALDYLAPSDADSGSASAKLAVINWNEVLLYPAGKNANDIVFAAKITLPTTWKFATALPVATASGQDIQFKPVSLTTLIDSPIFIGEYAKQVDLTVNSQPAHKLNLFGDSIAAITLNAAQVEAFKNLVLQQNALFGTPHYTHYDFLFALSDFLEVNGVEHHESSDNRSKEKTFSDLDLNSVIASLLPHEMVHSWNGKYRRPADLTTPDYQKPMKTDLLWVYEGLTEYLGVVLTARSGLWTAEAFRENLALIAAEAHHETGRTWRPLLDTAISAQFLYPARKEWVNWRRSYDFYDEMVLVWLEADTYIRQHTQNKKSLDDFCKAFFGGKNNGPEVKTYTLNDVINTMNSIAPNDWHLFFNTRLKTTSPNAPLQGIIESGWQLVYSATPNALIKGKEKWHKGINQNYTLGFSINDHGTVIDVTPNMPAAQAGIAPGMKIIAINGRRWSEDLLKDTISSNDKNSPPIAMIVENGDYFHTVNLKYQSGTRYPHLVRNQKPDLLTQIITPLR